MEVKHRGPSDDQQNIDSFFHQITGETLNGILEEYLSLQNPELKLRKTIECDYLETNMLRCLKEKAVSDNVQKMTCKPEFLVWFFLECPTRTAVYHDNKGLRNLFIQEKLKNKQGDGLLERK